jgi:hypothetical protein
MSNQTLTFIICVGLPLAGTVLIAILSTYYRLKFAERLLLKTRAGGFDSWYWKQNGPKVRRLALLVLISTTGVVVMTIFMIAGKLAFNSIPVLIVYFLLGLTGVVAGAILYHTISNQLK